MWILHSQVLIDKLIPTYQEKLSVRTLYQHPYSRIHKDCLTALFPVCVLVLEFKIVELWLWSSSTISHPNSLGSLGSLWDYTQLPTFRTAILSFLWLPQKRTYKHRLTVQQVSDHSFSMLTNGLLNLFAFILSYIILLTLRLNIIAHELKFLKVWVKPLFKWYPFPENNTRREVWTP